MILQDLKTLRTKLGYTQLDVALAIGVSRQTYNRWEKHQSVMPLGMYASAVDELERAKTVREGGLLTGNTVLDQKENSDERLEGNNN